MKHHRLFSIIALFLIIFIAPLSLGQVSTVSAARNYHVTLNLQKTAAASEVPLGQPISFTVTFSNTGGLSAQNLVVSDTLPVGPGLNWSIADPIPPACQISAGVLLCSIANFPPGGNLSVTVTSPTVSASCGVIRNTALATFTNTGDAIGGNTSATAETTITCPAEPALSIVKTPDANEVPANSPVGFSITVTNTGAGTANNVVIEDQLNPALDWTETTAVDCTINPTTRYMTCTIPTLAAGDSTTVHVLSAATGSVCGQITNTASVSAEGLSSIEADPAVVTITCPPNFNVILTKLAEQDRVDLGGLVQFTMTVTNAGPMTAQDVTLTDLLPVSAGLEWSIVPPVAGCAISNGSLVCQFGALTPNDPRSVTISSTAGTGSCGTISNTATVTATDEPGDRLTDNTASDSVDVPCPTAVNVTIAKTAAIPMINKGEPATFRLQVINNGLDTAQGVMLEDSLPTGSGLSWSIVQPIPTGCTIGAGSLSCDFGALAPGATSEVSITSLTVTPGEIINTAKVSATNETAGNQGDNEATANIIISEPACVSVNPFVGIYKNDFESVRPGDIGLTNYRHTTAPKGQQFMGEYGNETASLLIGCLPAHTHLLVSFDLYIIRSWDGNAAIVGPDRWKMELRGNNVPLVDTTFSNWSWSHQSYPGRYPTGDFPFLTGNDGIEQLGYVYTGYKKDTIYHFTMFVPHTDMTAIFDFTAFGLQELFDESWGLDNITISPTTMTPTFMPFIQRDGTIPDIPFSLHK